jgi:hypothetical protein
MTSCRTIASYGDFCPLAGVEVVYLVIIVHMLRPHFLPVSYWSTLVLFLCLAVVLIIVIIIGLHVFVTTIFAHLMNDKLPFISLGWC